MFTPAGEKLLGVSMANRSYNWCFIVYPESALPDWQETLKQTHLPIAISPLHDKDLVKETGELKKPHYHVLICFESLKTQKQVQDISNLCSGVLPVVCLSVKGSYEYWVHLNDRDKYQYSDSGRTNLNGFSIPSTKKEETEKGLFELLDIISSMENPTFKDLVQTLRINQQYSLLHILAKYSFFVSKLVR